MELYSQHYSQEPLFILVLFNYITIHSSIITKNIDNIDNIHIIHIIIPMLFIICTNANFFLIFKFLPIQV